MVDVRSQSSDSCSKGLDTLNWNSSTSRCYWTLFHVSTKPHFYPLKKKLAYQAPTNSTESYLDLGLFYFCLGPCTPCKPFYFGSSPIQAQDRANDAPDSRRAPVPSGLSDCSYFLLFSSCTEKNAGPWFKLFRGERKYSTPDRDGRSASRMMSS